MKRTMIIGLLWFTLMFIALYRVAGCYLNSHRVVLDSPIGKFYYWMWDYRTVTHGICANMYGSDDKSLISIWAVEIPKHGQPTALYQFNSRLEAEAFAEGRCPSRNKEWKEVK